jgi:hypothetical protein
LVKNVKITFFLKYYTIRNITNPTGVIFDEQTQMMVIKIMMDNSQYERYLENFVIKRDIKKRQDKSNI